MHTPQPLSHCLLERVGRDPLYLHSATSRCDIVSLQPWAPFSTALNGSQTAWPQCEKLIAMNEGKSLTRPPRDLHEAQIRLWCHVERIIIFNFFFKHDKTLSKSLFFIRKIISHLQLLGGVTPPRPEWMNRHCLCV